MDIVLGIVFILFLGYFFLLLFYLWHWDRIPEVSSDINGELASTCVVVPVRNEASGIEKCIDSILKQDYSGEFSIIVVDDYSTDGTAEIIRRRYASTPVVKLIKLADRPDLGNGKKAALTCGIVEATSDIIVTTDGDCIFSPGWLRAMISCFDDVVQIVTGPVLYPDGSKMLLGFQVLDLLSLILATGGGIQSRNFFLGNGANLAFRKRTFTKVDGYSGNLSFVSGDDLFLIEKIVDNYGVESIGYAKSKHAAVLADPALTWRAFINQRIRWASKNRALSGRRVYYMWIFIWSVNAAVLFGLISAVFGYISLLNLALLLYAKMLIEGIALNKMATFFDTQRVMRWFPWGFFLNVLYVFSIGLLVSVRPSFEWKGRREGDGN